MEVLIAIVIVVLVAAWVTGPFRHAEAHPERLEDPLMAELEARKQAKYREIRDAEMDHAQRKTSDAEFARQNAELRAEAIQILKEIDEAEAARKGEGRADPAPGA